MASVKSKWVRSADDDSEGIEEILSTDVFENWQKSRMPEARAEEELFLALEMRYGGKISLCKTFLSRCLLVCERAMREKKWQSAICIRRFPLNRGHLFRAHGYANSLSGQSLDKDELTRSAQDIVDACREAMSDWDDQIQSYYLSAIRANMIASDFEKARALLAVKKKFTAHKQEFEQWKTLLRSDPGRRASMDIAEYDVLFDKVRDPGFSPKYFTQPHILRLELAAIRQTYFFPGKVLDWKKVTDQVSI